MSTSLLELESLLEGGVTSEMFRARLVGPLGASAEGLEEDIVTRTKRAMVMWVQRRRLVAMW